MGFDFRNSLWRDVFQNYRDTRLLIDVLKSATAIHSSSTKETPIELIKSLKSIQSFITSPTRNYELPKYNWGNKDVQERSTDVKSRQHAVLFFNILKSLKVTSLEADAYYETVHLESCNIVWYFDLLCHLNWHECFIQCAMQLPDNVMLYLCQQLLALESEPHLKGKSFSLYYVIMQSIIWKCFIKEDPQIAALEEKSPKFSFPFTLPKTLNHKENISSIEELISVYKILLDKSRRLGEYTHLKLLLHAIKLILKNLLKVETFEGNFVKELFLTASYIGDRLLDNNESTSLESSELISVYREESAGISVEYLIIIISAYHEGVETLMTQKECCFSMVSSDLKSLLNKNIELAGKSFLVQKELEKNQKITALLETAIQNNYPCSHKAAEILLLHPKMLCSPNFIKVLNSNKTVLKNEKNLIMLLNTVFLSKGCPESPILLLFDVLSSTPGAIYYNILKYRILCLGDSTELKHPEFADQVNQFGRKTLEYEEAEKTILHLLIQSPSEVIPIILAQALDQGKEGMELIKVLTNVGELIHSNLLSEIALYFSSEDENHLKMLKHMPLVIETVVKNNRPGKLFEKLMKICILPHLGITDKLDIVLNCFNVALRNLEKNEGRCLNHALVMKYLLKSGTLLSECIVSHRSHIKEQVIEGMTLMYSLFPKDFTLSSEDVALLKSNFEDYHPAIHIYMNDFLGCSVVEVLENTTLNLNELMWTWSCFTNNQEILQKCISQPQFSREELLKVLNSVFLHFTLKEWIRSSLFIRESCKHLHPSIASAQKPWKLNDINFQLYATVKCLIDSLSSILRNHIETSASACINFTNTVMNLLEAQDTQPETLLYIFMDMCPLAKVTDFWKTFSSFLIAILKQTYQCCKDKTQKKVFKTLFTNILKHLPESEDKLAILEAV